MFPPCSPKARFWTARDETGRDEESAPSPALPSELGRRGSGQDGAVRREITICRVRIPAGSQPLVRGKEGLRDNSEVFLIASRGLGRRAMKLVSSTIR